MTWQNMNWQQALGYGTPQGFGAFTPNQGSYSYGSQPMGGGGGSGQGFFGNNGNFGWNANTLNFGMQGLQGIGNLWGAWQSHKLAKDQLNFTKNFANRNLANQTAAYNTALEDRGRSRAAVEGQTSAEAQAYIDRNRLPTRG